MVVPCMHACMLQACECVTDYIDIYCLSQCVCVWVHVLVYLLEKEERSIFLFVCVAVCVVRVYVTVCLHAFIAPIEGLAFVLFPCSSSVWRRGRMWMCIRAGWRWRVQGPPLLAACILIISRTEEVCCSYLGKDTILKTSQVLRIRCINSGA